MNWKHLLLLVAISTALMACGEAPETAYKRLVFNAKTGNEAAFLKGFTKDSAKLVKTLLALRRTYGTQMEVDPYLSLALEEIEGTPTVESKSERILNDEGDPETLDVDIATLTVSDGKRTKKICMRKTEEGWKVDALDTQKYRLLQSSKQTSCAAL